MKKIVILLIAVLSISSLLNVSYAVQDCSKVSVFHMKQLDIVLQCLEQRDAQQISMIDATNRMIDERLTPIETELKLRNNTDTDIITNSTVIR